MLTRLADSVSNTGVNGLFNGMAAFSPVSGLDGAGRTHSRVSSTSAPEANRVLGEWLQTIADVLRVSTENTARADNSVAGILGSIGVVERSGGAGAVSGLMTQAMSHYDNAKNFSNPRPTAGAQASLPVLHGQLMTTQVAQATAAAAFWGQNAALIQSVIAQLPGVAAMLADSADTEFVARAVDKLGDVARVGQEYVARSVAMQGHAAGLAQVAGAEQLMAHGAMSVYAGLPGPSRLAFERSYLGVFPPRLTASLQPVVPVFDRLLPDLGSIPGNGFAVPDMPEAVAAAFEDSPLPRTLRDAFSAAGLSALGNAATPAHVVAEYGMPNPEVLEQVAAKAPGGSAATQAASAGLGQIAPQPGGAFGGGAVPAGGAPLGGAAMPVPAGAGAGAGAGAAGGFAPGQTIAAGGGASSGAGGAAAGPMGAGTRGRGAGRVGGGRHAAREVGGSAASAAGAIGAGAAGAGIGGALGAGAGMAGRPLSGVGNGMPGAGGNAAPGLTQGAAGGTGGNAAGSRGGAMAAGPMGASRGADKKGKPNAKVKAVTSAVERDGNLEALLGESPLVLPTVIGSNVRG
ncbi:hypothetical protein [Corynebacterium sp. NML180780]|uniref:hypothetical protein n=1 Tax=Corynebacterium sp. NML180780 TaxID=2598459 RepID=UPI0011906293|nr:hypothetical protein [Corynebacterium sp. NML180780]TVX76459.1 hypothetical protein FPP74_11105 [Corynebacterium sp. NML180780]